MRFSDSDYIALARVFSSEDITKSSKAELERYLVMLTRPTAFTHFGELQYPQVCETVRTLLTIRSLGDTARVPFA